VARPAAWGLLFAAIAAGTLSDRPRDRAPIVIGGYRVLAADFHVHPALVSAGALAPWDLLFEARRQGLDAFAITPHNQVFPATIGPWLARVFGGPTILVGEEVRGPKYHLIAVGIAERVSWDQPAAAAIDEIHRQGGVAIAAHPVAEFWPAYSADAMAMLDGSEVMHPSSYRGSHAGEFRQFYERGRLAAIGSSDFHGVGRLGLCRTYVFAKDNSVPAILDALRARRTVVYDEEGRAIGDPEMIRLAEEAHVRSHEPGASERGALVMLSRSGAIALAALAFLAARRREPVSS
jgi:hypothetical protein